MRALLGRAARGAARWVAGRLLRRRVTGGRSASVPTTTPVLRPSVLAADVRVVGAAGDAALPVPNLVRVRGARRAWTVVRPGGLGARLLETCAVAGRMRPADVGLAYAVLRDADGTQRYYAGTDDLSAVLSADGPDQ